MKAEKVYRVTRKQLIAAFRRWNAETAKSADGKMYLDNRVTPATFAAANLIGYLSK